MSERRPLSTLEKFGIAGAIVLVVVVQLLAIERQSLTMDEPYHLLAGYQALRFGSNDLNWEHPPLVKLVAALPLVVGEAPHAWRERVRLDSALAVSRALFENPALATTIRRTSRACVLVAFGLPFFAAVFLLGREIGGTACGFTLLLFLGFAAMGAPYVALVQTDSAVALGFAATLLALLRYARAPSLPLALAVGAGLGLALAAKFSALLLVPLVAVAMPVPVAKRVAASRRVTHLAAAAGAALVAVALPYAVANRSADPGAIEASIRTYAANRGTLIVDRRMEALESRLLAVAKRSPALAQIWTGVAGIRIQNELGVYPSYAFGGVTSRGRWWFFPALLSIRLSILVLIATLLVAIGWRRQRRDPAALPENARAHRRFALALLGGTAAIYLGTAMTSSYNLGSRHLLPILPLLLLPAAFWVSANRRRVFVVGALLALEAVALTPRWMAATNTWWLGDRNPTRFALGAGDTEYKQNFLELAREAKRRGISGLRVVFPGTGTTEVAASIPGASVISPGEAVAPGWYAVTVLAEKSLPAFLAAEEAVLHEADLFRALAGEWLPLMEEISRGEDHGYVASSFHLFRVPGAER